MLATTGYGIGNTLLRKQNSNETAGLFMLNYFWVALGGALGSVARYWLWGAVAKHFGETFPLGTLLINVSGSFIIGLFATLFGPESRWLAPPSVRIFFIVGVLGGYTTFSSFSLETLNLARNGDWLAAGLNALMSFVLCLFAVWIGHLLGLALSAAKGV